MCLNNWILYWNLYLYIWTVWLFSIYFFRGQKRILAEEVEDLNDYFRSYEGSKNYVDIVGFRKLIGAKNDYYSGRIFKLVDQNNDNQVCIDEYTEFMTKLSPDDQNGMIEFLFKIFDTDGTYSYKQSFWDTYCFTLLKAIYKRFTHGWKDINCFYQILVFFSFIMIHSYLLKMHGNR